MLRCKIDTRQLAAGSLIFLRVLPHKRRHKGGGEAWEVVLSGKQTVRFA